MSRRKPILLEQKLDEATWLSHQILTCDKIYVVQYKGEMISYRQVSYLMDSPGPRYKRTFFTAKCTAVILCNKLNNLFNSNDFTVGTN